MKRTILTPAQAAFLTRTMARNRSLYGGFTMMADEGDSGSGDGGQGAGDSGGDSGQGDKGDKGGDAAGSDRGFPANTPVAEMTVDQRAAYWQHQAQKHEGRNKDLLAITGGKYGDALRAELEAAETARRDKLSADERAVEDAKRQAREETAREFGPKSVRAAFNLLLGDMPEQERNAEIELLDLSKFLTNDGDVDTAKVRQFAAKIAPADKGQGERNYGQGQRGGATSSGVAAGRGRYQERRGKTAS